MSLHGGLITKHPLCYTKDGRLLLAPCGIDIRIYSARSGDHIATLRGHDAEVTSVVQDTSSDKLVLSASLDGTLRQWDIQEGVVRRTWTFGGPIESMGYSAPTGLAYVSIHHKGGQSGRVQCYLLSTGEEQPGRLKTSRGAQLVLSPSGTHVAAVDKHSLFVWAAGRMTAAGRTKPLNLVHTKAYTCAAFDATDSIIAAGDVTGRILIWHNFPAALQEWARGPSAAAAAVVLDADALGSPRALGSSPVKLPSCTTVHWHAHAVGGVCFSVDGSYLMSGGQEGVLVQWSVPTNKRTYLPRLGGPLNGITTSPADSAKFIVSHSDNTVRLINMATMAVELSIHGLRPAPPAAALAAAGYGASCSSSSSSPAGVVVQPGGGVLVLPVDPSSLQFFDVNRDRHIARLQVSPCNPVSMTELSTNHLSSAAAGQAAATAPLQPAVVLVAFTGDGQGLVTVDVRPATAAYGAVAAEATLRFWDRISSSQTASAAAPYLLNTTADCPHKGAITGLSTHPWQDMAVTTGSEGDFKIWTKSRKGARRAAAAAAGGAAAADPVLNHWRCSSVGGYMGLGLNSCSFSHDGSLLAVAAGTTATLWDPYDNTLVTSLCCPAECSSSGGSLRQLVFMRNSPQLVGLLGGGDCTAALGAVGLQAVPEQQQQQQSRQQRNRQQQLVTAVQNSWGNAVVVWDLLNSSVKWYCSLPVCSLAADPVYPVFAVGVPAVLSTAAKQQQQQQQPAEDQQQQQQQQGQQEKVCQQQGQHNQGLVLVFNPNDSKPLLACPVPDSSPSSLVFMPSRSKQRIAAVGCQAAAGAISPLLLLTEDRRYTKVALAGTEAAAPEQQQQQQQSVPAGTRAAMEAELAAGGDESALEAMFGKIEQPAAAAAKKGSSAWAAAVEEAAAVKAAVAQLFDAPSHVLPAPTTLCPTLLELVIGVGRT